MYCTHGRVMRNLACKILEKGARKILDGVVPKGILQYSTLIRYLPRLRRTAMRLPEGFIAKSIASMKKRCGQTAADRYLKTREELARDNEIEAVFTKIDYDGSGKIDIKELRRMFAENGVDLTRDEIEKFFVSLPWLTPLHVKQNLQSLLPQRE